MGRLLVTQNYIKYFNTWRWCKRWTGKTACREVFFSSLFHLVPHIPLACDLAQAPKQTWSVHGYKDSSTLNSPKALPNWCCTVLEVGEAVRGCAKLWAIRHFILLSRSVTCPGCSILAPFKMCQLKQSLQNTSLSSHPVFPLRWKSCCVPPPCQHWDFCINESYWKDSWLLHYHCCARW